MGAVLQAGYGEGRPRPVDDRVPVVLITLDGLGDRPIPELGDGAPGAGRGLTPSEAALTPVLDRLTVRGACGWHVPFGWGPASASENAHWAMFGFGALPFPGRAVLEGLGAGIDVPFGAAVTFAALRASQADECSGQTWITGRVPADDAASLADADSLWDALRPTIVESGAEVHQLGRGEAVLIFHEYVDGAVTDSDPFFEDLHPWLRVRPTEPETQEFAAHLNQLLLGLRAELLEAGVNQRRREAGLPAFDVVTTKWSGTRRPLPSFVEHVGVSAGMVTSSRLYRGFATVFGAAEVAVPKPSDLFGDAGSDIAARLAAADDLLDNGAKFVHVHTKATDEAGHTKQPFIKREVLERIDARLTGLEAMAERAVVAVTGDHATPSVDGVLHTGDPTPLLLVGPSVRPDRVSQFGEAHFQDGWFGRVRSDELLPLLMSHANRPVFLGHRATGSTTIALPDSPAPMTDNVQEVLPSNQRASSLKEK